MKTRILLVSFACALACGPGSVAQAISEGVLLNQQSTQNAGNANLPTSRTTSGSSQDANRNAAQPATYSPTVSPRNFDDPARSKQPYLSEYAGYVTPGTELTISSPEPAATIFYTIDGWTPTEDSLRYAVPIKITHDMRVQAFALEPGMLPSPMVDATYIVKPQQLPLPKSLHIDDSAILRHGTALRLVTGSDAKSDSAQVGETLLLKLDQNIVSGDAIVATSGSLGKATITRVERAGRSGKPGLIAFKVDSLDVHGISIPLHAILTLAAADVAAQAEKISNPSAVRVSGTLPKGDEAVIEPGMPLTAIVGADTSLR